MQHDNSYIKCMKSFFKYPKFHSVTGMLLELGLPSFDTLLLIAVRFEKQVQNSQNSITAD